jgi:hypothetical protein
VLQVTEKKRSGEERDRGNCKRFKGSGMNKNKGKQQQKVKKPEISGVKIKGG